MKGQIRTPQTSPNHFIVEYWDEIFFTALFLTLGKTLKFRHTEKVRNLWGKKKRKKEKVCLREACQAYLDCLKQVRMVLRFFFYPCTSALRKSYHHLTSVLKIVVENQGISIVMIIINTLPYAYIFIFFLCTPQFIWNNCSPVSLERKKKKKSTAFNHILLF